MGEADELWLIRAMVHVTRRSVRLIRAPPARSSGGSGGGRVGKILSTPWKQSRASPPCTSASPEDNTKAVVLSERFLPPTRKRQSAPSETERIGASKSFSSRS